MDAKGKYQDVECVTPGLRTIRSPLLENLTMVADSLENGIEGHPPGKPLITQGATRALANVFKRVAASQRSVKRKTPSASHVVFAQSEEVKDALAEQSEKRKKVKKAKKEKIAFENNALVIPDAATGAIFEKQLLSNATKGSVALFNAIAKAQNALEQQTRKLKNKSNNRGPPLSKEGFMNVITEGLKDGNADNPQPAEDANDDTDQPGGKRTKPSWLKDDYMFSRSRKLKDWVEPSAKNSAPSHSSGSKEESEKISDLADEQSSTDQSDTNSTRSIEST